MRRGSSEEGECTDLGPLITNEVAGTSCTL